MQIVLKLLFVMLCSIQRHKCPVLVNGRRRLLNCFATFHKIVLQELVRAVIDEHHELTDEGIRAWTEWDSNRELAALNVLMFACSILWHIRKLSMAGVPVAEHRHHFVWGQPALFTEGI